MRFFIPFFFFLSLTYTLNAVDCGGSDISVPSTTADDVRGTKADDYYIPVGSVIDNGTLTVTLSNDTTTDALNFSIGDTTCPDNSDGRLTWTTSFSATDELNIHVYNTMGDLTHTYDYTLTVEFTPSPLGWQKSAADTAPANSAINMDIDADFKLLFGGAGYSIFGDIGATGDSVLYVNDPDTDNYGGALYDSVAQYMTKDATFNTTTYTGGDARKANSSTATLALPDHVEGKHIAWAGLFWQGYVMNDFGAGMTIDDVDKDITGWNNVTMKTPDGTMHQLTASLTLKDNTQSTYHYSLKDDNSYRHFYGAYVDVTTLVKNSYSATDDLFTVGNILTNDGEDTSAYMYFSHIGDGEWYDNLVMGYFGGWSLIVVYSLDAATITTNTTDMKNISIYNGYDLFLTWGVDGTAFETTVTLDGFMTPKAGEIDSRLLFFGGGVDQGIFDDTLQIQDGNSTTYVDLANGTNPASKQFNSSYTEDGVHMNPSKPYRQGMDLDIYDVSDMMTTDQSETNIRFGVVKDNGACDQIFPQVLAFSTELYRPRFCYDYSYSQHGRYFTEDNNGTKPPSLTGLVTPSEDIRLSLYVRSDEDADITARNLTMDITDINTTQATYIRNSVAITYPGEINSTAIPDGTDGMIVSDSDILNIPFGDVNGTQSIYSYYSLLPDLDLMEMPINAEVTYDITFPDANGDPFNLTYTSVLGDHDFPLCTGANFMYEPKWSVFNVVQSDIYDPLSGAQYYNIPTQVTRRPGSFDLVAYDADDVNTELHVSTMVGVELIDAGAYHDINASCYEPSSAITTRVWVFFEGNVTRTPFDRDAIQKAIDNGFVSDQIFNPGGADNLTVAEDFYKEARENTAFRIIYNALPDINGSLVDVQPGTKDGMITIANFPELHQLYPKCKQLVKNPLNTTMTDQTAVACSNAGSNSTHADLAICMECLFGLNSNVLCSRDNFATRPESFNITLSDMTKDSNASAPLPFATDRTGVASPSTAKVHLSSGYPYHFSVTATNHYSNVASPGYNHTITNTLEDNASFVWSPSDPTAANANCNDLDDVAQTVSFLQGSAGVDLNVTQVGEYLYKMTDSTWTKVDWDPASMSHHNNSYFYGYNSGESGTPAKDCAQDQSTVPTFGAVATAGTYNGYAALSNVSGCKIKSEHTNSDAGLVYKDYDILFHSYEFDLSDINASYGVGENQDFTDAWLYMNDLVEDANQSFHLRGNIAAVSADGKPLSNFVDGCYAQDISLTLSNNAPASALPDVPAYIYRFLNTDGTNILADENGTLTSTGVLFTLTDGNFSKGLEGRATIDLNSNFSRTANNSVNPFTITIGDFDTKCATPLDCQMQADMAADHEVDGTLAIDQSLPYYYGRVHAPRYRISDNTGTVRLYYEVYCNPNSTVNPCLITDPTDHNVTMPNRILSVDDIRWYRNEVHTSGVEGDIETSLIPKGADYLDNNIRVAYDQATFTYDESKGYPYKTTITIPTDQWLVYNKFDATARINFFELEFNSAGSVAGKHIGVSSSDSNSSKNTNRRISW